MQQIGEKLPRSTSIIYTYYDGKEDLLFDLLRHLLQWLEPEEPVTDADPHEQLLSQIGVLLNLTNERVDRNGLVTIAVLRANTQQNVRFQEEFERIDTVYKNHFSTLIELGIENDRYRTVDPETVASYLYSTILGQIVLSVTTHESGDAASIEHEIKEYIRSRLLRS
jgi:AcrR family transcriptional regulator